MLRKILAILLVFVVAGWALTGCNGKEEVPESEVPKTVEEYGQEVAESITTENVEDELDKLEAEIEADPDQE